MTPRATWTLWSLFGIIALGPFGAAALSACESAQAERPPITPSATADTSVAAVTASASASGPAVVSVALPASSGVLPASSGVLAAVPPPASAEPPPGKVQAFGPCAGSRGVAAYIDAHRRCASDADCAIEATGCGMPMPCGAPIQTSAVAGLRAKSDAAYSACLKAGVPMACPTCPAPPRARCGSGYCR